MGKSLLDEDFIEADDEINNKDDLLFPEPQELEVEKPKKGKDEDKIEIEIVDDTPEKDRGKWVADDTKDGEPELPNEEEVKNYTKDVQKRINALTARMHAERRAKEEIERQNAERDALLKRIIEENNNLKGLVENGEKVLIGEHKGRLEGQLAQAKAMYREASEAGDTNGLLAAQEQIARVVAQIERLSSHRPQALPREELPKFEKPAEQQPKPQIDPKAVEWQKRNPWFGQDDAMTQYALGYHRQLVNEGVAPNGDEYYARINQEMRKRFADRFPSQPSPRTGSVVAPASRQGSRSAAPRRVVLTESQVRLARRLGLTNEQYAEQLIAEQDTGNGKEFTHTSRP